MILLTVSNHPVGDFGHGFLDEGGFYALLAGLFVVLSLLFSAERLNSGLEQEEPAGKKKRLIMRSMRSLWS